MRRVKQYKKDQIIMVEYYGVTGVNGYTTDQVCWGPHLVVATPSYGVVIDPKIMTEYVGQGTDDTFLYVMSNVGPVWISTRFLKKVI